METLKEIALPSNFCLALAILGVIAHMRPATRRMSRRLVVGAGLLLATLSSGWTAWALLVPLEYATTPASLRTDDPPATAIVVLAAFGEERSYVPVSSWPNGSALFRIVEAVHLRDRCPQCPVVVSGNAPTVEVMAKLFLSLGVPEESLVLDRLAGHTVQSARNLAARISGRPFYLVTSAGHMPRAVLAFRMEGLDPLPAPTDYRVPRRFPLDNVLPAPLYLYYSDVALREHAGILWYRLRDWLRPGQALRAG